MAVNITTLSQTVPILSFTHSLEPSWASDAGRNSNSGKFTGTFIGYFSKVTIEFGRTTQTQMTAIKNAFESATFEMTYPSKDGTSKTEYFYGTAISGKKTNWNGKYDKFSINLIGVAKY